MPNHLMSAGLVKSRKPFLLKVIPKKLSLAFSVCLYKKHWYVVVGWAMHIFLIV